jgi:hypothetical protein
MNSSMSFVDRSRISTPRLFRQRRATLSSFLSKIRRLTSAPNYLGEIGGF